MTSDSREADLVQQAIAGDRSSLSQLLLLHYDSLNQHIAARISGELQGLVRPDDILQQTFVRAAQSVDRFEMRSEASFRAWLKTIAANLIKDAEKRRRRERRLPGQGGQGIDDESVAAVVERIAGDSTSPSRRVSRKENIRRMRVALASLPADQREVIQRQYLQDQSLAEISRAMGRTKDAVRGISYRARKNLRAVAGGSSLYFSG